MISGDTLGRVGAVAFVLLSVLAPVAPTAALGAAATTADVPDAIAPPTVAGGAADESVRFDGAVRPEKLSGGLRLRLRGAAANEPVPVLVVFEHQPDEALALDRLGATEARQRMRALAADTQPRVLAYLERQRERGRANDVRSFWIRNVVAVEAHPAVVEELTASTRVARVVHDRPVRSVGGGYAGAAGAFLDGLEEYGNLSVSPDGLERNTSGVREWSVEYVGADAVQEAGVTGEGVNVSVVDTGIDDDHPAIPEVARWKDFVDASNAAPVDPNGHGTHVAGTIAGRPDADRAVGVAPGATLFGARVLGASGSGRSSDIIEAFQWSVNGSADVVSASLGRSPILDSQTRSVAVGSGGSENGTFRVFATANATRAGNTDHAFRPAFVLVQAEPVEYDGSVLAVGSPAQARAEENVSLALRDPTGNRSLRGSEAGYMYESGEVPDGLKLYKYEPSTVRELRNGTWSLEVRNANPGDVTVDVTAVPVYPSNGSDEFSRVVDNVAAQGVVPVVAAGNDGAFFGNQSVGSPGTAEEAITVGASGYRTNDVAPFSSRGPVGFGPDARPGVDLLAPGTDVVSAGSTEVYAGDEPYVTLSGTSMATPHVSGTVALLLSRDSAMSVSEVESALRNAARPVPGGGNAVGAGVLDAWAAVNGTAPLDAPGTERGVRDLWAGIGNTGERYVDIDPPTDAVGDAGDAPDFEVAHAGTSDDPEFGFGFADAASPNASLSVYVDADGNGTTGSAATAPPGAEYRFDAVRTYAPGNGTYDLAVTPHAYDESAAAFERANVRVYGERADGDFVGFGVDRSDLAGVDDRRFGWYAVSRNATTGDADRAPDEGVLDTVNAANVSGVAVAWNASAGRPAAGVPVEFRVYDRSSGALVGNDTVRTNASGLAETSLAVEAVGGFGDFTLEVEDDRNNLVSQTYGVRVEDPAARYFLDDRNGLGYEVAYGDYLSEPNATVPLRIPIYRIENGSYDTYGGPASVRLRNDVAPVENRTVYLNDLSVSEGVLRTTVDFGTLPVDDYGGGSTGVDVTVALESDFENRTGGSAAAGSVDLVTERYETDLGPDSTVVTAGSAANLTFQSVLASTDSERGTPANVTTGYDVTWVTDRYVAAVHRDLPSSTARTVRRARDGGAALGAGDYHELEEAVRNVSADGTDVESGSGRVSPTRRGVGDLRVVPPADARFGIVTARVDASAAGDTPVSAGRSTVFVEDRFEPYVGEPTAPEEDDRYRLLLDASWPDHTEAGYVVPNRTIEVDVALYDDANDTYVDGATVSLYTSGGDATTVATDGSGEVTATVPTPALDYRDVSGFDLTEQQVVGIAQGYRRGDGRAVADEEYVYASAYRVGVASDVRPDPHLSWADGALTLTLEYRNGSFDRVNGTETLVRLGSPDFRDVRDEAFVGFVNRANASVYADSFAEPVPAGVPRGWRVGAQTPGLGYDTYRVAGARASGPRVTLASPDALRANVTQDVTLNVTDRDGRPVEGAVVRFGWVDSVPVESPGESSYGTTGADGRVALRVTPPATDGDVAYEVGLATADFGATVYDRGRLAVQSEPASVTGRLALANGSAAAADRVVASPRSGASEIGLTDAEGRFDLSLDRNGTYSLGYYQDDGSSAASATGGRDADDFARDGNVDAYGFANVTASDAVDLGSRRLPAGHVLDVAVVDGSGDGVENATVTFYHWNGSHGDASDGRAESVHRTGADGRVYPNAVDSGVELTGSVTVRVEPPANPTAFVDEPSVRDVTVTGDRNLTITLRELESGDLVATPDDVDANVTTARFALANATFDGATPAEYRWAFGDGESATTVASDTAHVYTHPGEYGATVAAVDADGSVLASAETTVAVTRAGDADLAATPSTADVNVTNVTLALSNASVDPDVAVANYTFAFGDGERVTTGAATTSVEHTYGTPSGALAIRVVATDATGTTLFAERANVTVTDRAPPEVRVDAPRSVPRNAEFVVNASASSDNHRIANYVFETDAGYSDTSDSPTRTLNFSDPGNHTVTVAAIDAVGNADDTTVTVEVRSRSDPAVEANDDNGDDGDGGDGGGGLPGGGSAGEVEISGGALLNGSVSTGQPVVARVDLANPDPASGRIALRLHADGATVAERTVSVRASTERTVYLDARFGSPGTYALSVNGAPVGSVTVEASTTPAATSMHGTPTAGPGTPVTPAGPPSGTAGTAVPGTATPRTTTSGDGTGFGPVAALAALALGLALVAARRRD